MFFLNETGVGDGLPCADESQYKLAFKINGFLLFYSSFVYMHIRPHCQLYNIFHRKYYI